MSLIESCIEHLGNGELLDHPIPCRGQIGFFEVALERNCGSHQSR